MYQSMAKSVQCNFILQCFPALLNPIAPHGHLVFHVLPMPKPTESLHFLHHVYFMRTLHSRGFVIPELRLPFCQLTHASNDDHNLRIR